MTKKKIIHFGRVLKKGNGVQEFPFVTLLIRGAKPNQNGRKVILKLDNNHYLVFPYPLMRFLARGLLEG